MKLGRRDLVRSVVFALCGIPAGRLLAKDDPGNFRYIYSNPSTREEFKKFLVNVFHLYPQDDLHALIRQAVQQGHTDTEIYQKVQNQLGSIKPILGDLTYALPTLAKQKQVLTDQTVSLIDTARRYEGYLEVGSNGRFLDSLEDRLKIEGDLFTMSDRAPTYGAFDVVDRGQINKAGTFISMNDYRPDLLHKIPARSLDLVTVYIGFHHCPIELRSEFMGSFREILRPNGVLIVRDHNVTDEHMWRMVALAHDVFNLGTKETLAYNERERRNFYSLADLDAMLTAAGFKPAGQRLLQDGDPTLNTLMKYTRA